MLFKLLNLNANLALTLGYLNPALNNSAQLYMLRSLQFKNAVDSVSVHGNKHAKCSLLILHNRTPVNVRVEKKN